MDKKTYPKPDRSDFKPHFTKTADDDVVDLGYNEGMFSDGRPYRVERWIKGGITTLTCFFSTLGTEGYSKEDLKELLEEEGLLYFTAPVQYVAAQKLTDPSGNELWSVNVVVSDEEVSYVDENVEVKAYNLH